MLRKIIPVWLVVLSFFIGIYMITRPTQPRMEPAEVFTPVLDSNSLKIPVTVESVNPDSIKSDFTPEELIQLQKEIEEYDSLERLRPNREEKGAN